MATGYVLRNDRDLLDAALVERDDADEVEVVFAWGDNVLATKHFAPGATICVGEAKGCEFSVPADVLGAPSIELATFTAAGAEVHAPAWAEVRVSGMVRTGTGPLELRRGHPVEVRLRDFVVAFQLVAAGKAAPIAPWDALREGALGSVGTSALFHAAIIAALAFFMPSMGGDDAETITHDQIAAMRVFLDSAAERDRELPPADAADGDTASHEAPSGGAAAMGADGAMGRTTNRGAGHWSAKGDAKPSDVTLSRDATIAMARDFGMIGLISAAAWSDPNAPTVPWGSELLGSDKESHAGNLWAGDIGDAFGFGLGLSGTGEGGGGRGEGIGINDFGGLGRSLGPAGSGTCLGANCDGWGRGHARVGGTHVAKAPPLRMPKEITTNGRLPSEVIQRIVRQNQGRFINCYTNGLRSNPSLTGRVAVKFIIDRQGGVSLANDAGSDLPDAGVRECVVRTFYSLSFPAPESGTVQVTYPLVFSPTE